MDAAAIRLHMLPNGLLLKQSPFGSQMFCELQNSSIAAGNSGTVYRCEFSRTPCVMIDAFGKTDCV